MCIVSTSKEIILGIMRRVYNREGFPDGSVAKKPLANAGDEDLIPGLGRSYMLQSNEVCVPQLLSLYPKAWMLQQLETTCPRAHALQQEKRPQ